MNGRQWVENEKELNDTSVHPIISFVGIRDRCCSNAWLDCSTMILYRCICLIIICSPLQFVCSCSTYVKYFFSCMCLYIYVCMYVCIDRSGRCFTEIIVAYVLLCGVSICFLRMHMSLFQQLCNKVIFGYQYYLLIKHHAFIV